MRPHVYFLGLFLAIIVHQSFALVPDIVRRHDRRQILHLNALPEISETDASLAAWTLAFSSTHIGMSAIRDSIIHSFGRAADSAKLVGNENWRLPAFWPGDEVGNHQIFPTAEIAGRQLYRAFYTLVSFITLGSALNVYLSSQSTAAGIGMHVNQVINDHPLSMMTAVAANTASLSSLANASPLGLMPSFETTQGNNEDTVGLRVNRNDSLKFQVRGLTRITRHPLILPVVPWGIANAIVLGGSLADWIFFGGLSLYAICGCLAQDLRVSRQEGSVGTTFEATGKDKSSLQQFFYSTSFVPFGAVLDGRQSVRDVVREIPWLAVVVALPVGIVIEEKMLEWLIL